MPNYRYVHGYDPDYATEHRYDDPLSRAILYGSLMGQAHISYRETDANDLWYYREETTIENSQYLEWKNATLKIKYTEFERQNGRRYCRLHSRNNTEFRNLWARFYNHNRKRITRDILNEMDEVAMLVWYLDDGHYNPRNEQITINTNKYTAKETETISEWLEERWNIKSNTREGRIHMDRHNTERMLEVVYPLFRKYTLPKCVISKMGHFAPENQAGIARTQEKYRLKKNRAIHISPETARDIMAECARNECETYGLLYGEWSPKKKITGYVVIPFPSTTKGVYFDSHIIDSTELPDEEYMGSFHSHVKGGYAPSIDDCKKQRRLFPDDKYLMMIISTEENDYMIYDHIRENGDYRLCSPQKRGRPHRKLPHDDTIIRHIEEDDMTPKSIAERYKVTKGAVYAHLRRMKAEGREIPAWRGKRTNREDTILND